MSVYFVYRSHYNTPTLNHVKVFDDETVLDWFCNHWTEVDEESEEYIEQLLGCEVYGFSSLFGAISEFNLAPPKTPNRLRKYLKEHLYVEGEILFEDHLIQVLTDDDELQMAYYFFDDDYLKSCSSEATFLLHDWELPVQTADQPVKLKETSTVVEPAGSDEGTTYFAFLTFYDSGNLDDCKYAFLLDGVRMPTLAQYLERVSPEECAWPLELLVLRSQLRSEHEPDSTTVSLIECALNAVKEFPWVVIDNRLNGPKLLCGSVAEARENMREFIQAFGNDSSYDPGKSKLQVDEHIAQISLHVDVWEGVDVYKRWIMFDDLWANKNWDLANCILRYCNRWDVLS